MTMHRTWARWGLSCVAAGWVPAAVMAQEAADDSTPEKYIGEVTANDVYVRSGPSANYYPVTKLSAGTRVVVVGGEHSWLKIEPPAPCYSLIAEQYVDSGDGQEGVVNGDNVHVRAGSDLSQQKYAIQCKLRRGAEVRIVGQTEDRYYKIVPPPSASLWISGEFVARVPDERLGADAVASADLATVPTTDGPSTQETVADQPPKVRSEPGAAAPAGTTSPTLQISVPTQEEVDRYRQRLEEAEGLLMAEQARPVHRRDYGAALAAFEALVDQQTDAYSRLWAQRRIDQIAASVELLEAVRRVRDLGEQVRTERKDYLARRGRIGPYVPPMDRGFDAEGELRPSAIYTSASGPRRYRLIDPEATTPRTLCYVEIPRDSGLNVNDFLGRRVGVRARQRRLQTGDVNPIAILTAAELIVLDAPQTEHAAGVPAETAGDDEGS